MTSEGVHRTHCCAVHGCKYGLTSGPCPVVDLDVVQAHLCEQCDDDGPLQFRFEMQTKDGTLVWTASSEDLIDAVCDYRVFRAARPDRKTRLVYREISPWRSLHESQG